MATYSRKHYIDMAKTLAETKATKVVIDRWCKKFKSDNPRFDEPKFRAFIKQQKR